MKKILFPLAASALTLALAACNNRVCDNLSQRGPDTAALYFMQRRRIAVPGTG